MAKERFVVRIGDDVLALIEHVARQRGDFDQRSSRPDGLLLAPAGADAMDVGAAILAALGGPNAEGRYGKLTTDELARQLHSVMLGLVGFLASAGKPIPSMPMMIAPGTAFPGFATGSAASPQASETAAPAGSIELPESLEHEGEDLGIGLLDE
jgi:hypothetical protein